VWFFVVSSVALAAWLYLAAGHGGFWRTSVRLPQWREPRRWPSVVAVVPARNEAAVLPTTLPSLLATRYPGDFRVVVVDDASADTTALVAARHGAQVVTVDALPAGWAGKVHAMACGAAAAGDCDFVLFTDADIRYSPTAVAQLVSAATSHELDLVSQMARLRALGAWERVIVPAFVYFFMQLFPFARVNSPRSRVAAAAGGCMLVRRTALESVGGLARIADAHIDDVALGTLLKRRGRRRIWLGLSDDVSSVRAYPSLRELWRMVARSAYTQLRYSPLLLIATLLGLLLVYGVPVIAVAAGGATGRWSLVVLGGVAWSLMAATFLPTLRFYRLSALRSLTLPVIALLYAAMTIDSAWQHARGRGGTWKGRTTARGQARGQARGRARA
jgi:hopene-associated glycosyltransferase HpnB